MWDFPPTTPVIQVGTLLIDWDRGVVSVAGQRVDLTRTELTLLCALAGAQGRILTKAWLVDTIWTDHDTNVGSGSLKTTICAVRVKLGREAWRLKTVRDLGYRLETDADRRSKTPTVRAPARGQDRRRDD